MNKNQIDSIIQEINSEVSSYQLRKENLAKFTDTQSDQECLSYINGTGGWYCKFLALLVNKLPLKNIVELGNREGMSTLSIYDGMSKDAHFKTVDISKDQRYCPNEMFLDPRVSFIFGDVCDLNIYKDIPIDIDLLFSDTIHLDFQLRNEWSVYEPLLANSALFAIDDINLNDKRKLFDELPYAKWDLTKLCHGSGWGLVLYERTEILTKEERIKKSLMAALKIWKNNSDLKDVFIDNLPKNKLKKSLKSLLRKTPILHKLSIALRK